MKYIITLLIVLSVTLFYGQHSSPVQIQGDMPVKLGYDYKNKYASNNELLKLLAPSQAKTADQLWFQYTLKYKIQGIIASKIVWQIFLSTPRIEQTIRYKAFDISQVLIPGRADFSLVWRDKSSNIKKSYAVNKLEMKGMNDPSEKIVEPDTSGYAGSSLEINDFVVYFDDKQFKSIKEKLLLIDEYYNADTRLKELKNALSAIKTDSINKVMDYKKTLENAKKTIDQTKDKKFAEKLSLQLNDPVELEKNLREISIQTQVLTDSIQKIISQMYLAWYKQGVRAKNECKNELAKQSFNKSIELKSDFVPAHLALIDIYQMNNEHAIAVSKILYVYDNLAFLPDEKTEMYRKLTVTITAMLGESAKLNKTGEYQQALAVCDSCQRISDRFKDYSLPDDFSLQRKTAVQGIFAKMAEPAKSQLNIKTIEVAQSIIDSAFRFAYQNIKWITDTLQVRENYKKIIELRIIAGNDEFKQKRYSEAGDQLNKAAEICRLHNFENTEITKLLIQVNTAIYEQMIEKADAMFKTGKLFSALQIISDAQMIERKYGLVANGRLINLLNEINLKRYQNLILQGQDEYSKNNCQDAVKSFEMALQMQLEHNYADTGKLKNQLLEAAKCYISFIIKKAEKEASKNQVTQAQYYHALAKNLINRYKISQDSILMQQFNSLNKAISSQECQNAQFEYEIQFNAALKFIEQKNFIEADNYLNKAIRISDEHATCIIETKSAIEKKEWLKPAIQYQKNFISIDKLVENQNFPDFLLKFEETRQLFESKQLDQYGFQFPDFYSFVRNQQPTDFMNDAIEYFTEKSEFDKALNLLNELFNRQILPERTKESQILLGMKLAAHDAVFNSKVNPRDQVKNYMKDESWYSVLKKTYLTEWKAKSKKK